jgi:hypothetical protein
MIEEIHSESINSAWDGIIIGGAGGAIAGITVLVAQYIGNKIKDCKHKKRIFNWLKTNTKNEAGYEFRSTRTIASYNNLTEDRVRYICSIHEKIHLSTGEKEDLWSIHARKVTA